MTNIATHGKIHLRDLGDGMKLTAEVSPCVFMYPGYPLQIQVTLHRRPGECLGCAYALDRTRTADTYTAQDIERLLAVIRTSPCSRCSAPAFDPATIETNRAGLCETCFLSDLNAEYAAAEEAEQRQLAERDGQQKLDGMKVRVSAWIHPADGGDDNHLDWYFAARPAEAQIRTLLREEGSTILDDYQIITL
jgi:hypothetical protein